MSRLKINLLKRWVDRYLMDFWPRTCPIYCKKACFTKFEKTENFATLRVQVSFIKYIIRVYLRKCISNLKNIQVVFWEPGLVLIHRDGHLNSSIFFVNGNFVIA